eukprot:3615873-Prymnesium_polylepis.1
MLSTDRGRAANGDVCATTARDRCETLRTFVSFSALLNSALCSTSQKPEHFHVPSGSRQMDHTKVLEVLEYLKG